MTITPAPTAHQIKLGLDIHSTKYVIVAQHDHATPKAPRSFAPGDFLPWIDRLRAEGHALHVVYEACGFGFGLCRKLRERGVDCQVIAPQRLDEKHTGVKTDGRDAKTLCLRLDRWLAGNRDALATIRIPTLDEEQKRQHHRQRSQFTRAKTKLQAQGRSMLVEHGLPSPALWWHQQQWQDLEKQLPAWIIEHLLAYRPVLAALEVEIKKLTERIVTMVQQSQGAQKLPKGLGELAAGVVAGEVMDWQRFNNRGQVSSYTGLCPGEPSGAR